MSGLQLTPDLLLLLLKVLLLLEDHHELLWVERLALFLHQGSQLLLNSCDLLLLLKKLICLVNVDLILLLFLELLL